MDGDIGKSIYVYKDLEHIVHLYQLHNALCTYVVLKVFFAKFIISCFPSTSSGTDSLLRVSSTIVEACTE